jgi:membrane dipeptidase
VSDASAASERAAALHHRALVVDAQGTSVLLPTALVPPPAAGGVAFLDRALRAGLTAMAVTMGVAGVGTGVDDFRAMVTTIQGYLGYFDLEPRVLHVERADDIARAKREGRLGVVFGCQGLPSKIDNDLDLLRILHKLGLRVAQLTYNERNAIGGGCLEMPDAGLTQFGRVAIRELNHLGVVVDLAHAGPRTTRDAIDASAKPIIVSHANARALNDNPRNVPDDVLKALGARRGFIGMTAYSPFVELKPGVRPRLDDVVTHVAHVAERAGVETVGIGSDLFEGESPVRFERFFRVRYPDVIRHYTIDTVYAHGFTRVDEFPQLTEALVRRGFADDEIVGILGGNYLRVLRENWRG